MYWCESMATVVKWKNEFARYMKASVIKEIDIQTLIEKLNNLPCCLNPFLESIMNNPNGLSQLLEIRRKNIKIKMYSVIDTYFFVNGVKKIVWNICVIQ